MKYVAMVNGREHTVTVDGPGSATLQETSHSVHLESIDGRAGGPEALFCLFVDGEPHEVFVERRDKCYHITIYGTRYDVRVEDAHLRRLGEWRDESGQEMGEATVISPMPGIVVDVLVQEGQAVQANDRLAILEAMKMENDIRAPCAGVVEGVHVVPGQTVNLRDAIVSIGLPPAPGSSSHQG